MSSFRSIYLTLAWRNIWRNKRRTFITMGSVVFAVVLAVLLNSIKEGMLYKMQENAVTFYTGAVQIHQPGYWAERTLENTFIPTDTLRQQVEHHQQVSATASRLESFALAASKDYTKACMVVGIEPDKEQLITRLKEKVIDGNYLSTEDKMVLLSSGLADYLKLKTGDTLVLIGQGYHGVNAAGKYSVKGILKLGSPELNKRVVYLPIQLAQELYGAEGRSTDLILKIDDINKAAMVARDLRAKLPDYEIMDWKTLLPELNQILAGERAENIVFLGILYLLISFGIFGTILMMLMERQFEFGVLVAVGMRKMKLSGIVVMENMFISVLGALFGTLLSIPVILYFYKYPIPIGGALKETYENFGFEPVFYFSIEPRIFYSQTIVVACIALVLSLYPLLTLLRIDPITAMRK
jgi:putative ABC transport system permease protein